MVRSGGRFSQVGNASNSFTPSEVCHELAMGRRPIFRHFERKRSVICIATSNNLAALDKCILA